MSDAFIRGRAEIVEKTYQWYQKMDKSFMKAYTNVRRKLDRKFEGFSPAKSDLTAAYDAFPKHHLSPDTSEMFSRVFSSTIHQLDNCIEIAPTYNLEGFESPSEQMQTTFWFKHSLTAPKNSIFSYLTCGDAPVDDVCTAKILSKFVPTYEPYAREILSQTDNFIEAVAPLFAKLTIQVRTALMDVKLFIRKINSCATSNDRENCMRLMVNQTFKLFLQASIDFLFVQLPGYDSLQSYEFFSSLSEPFNIVFIEVDDHVRSYAKSLYSMGTQDWEQRLRSEMEALKLLC